MASRLLTTGERLTVRLYGGERLTVRLYGGETVFRRVQYGRGGNSRPMSLTVVRRG